MSVITTTEGIPKEVDTLSDQEKKELVAAETASIISDTTLVADISDFSPIKSLHINIKGIDVLRLASPPSELSITIHNPNGSLAYTSTRVKRSSGSCTLTGTDGKPLIYTTYFLGPRQDPVLERLDVDEGMIYEIRTLSKWTSRNHKFLLPDGRTSDWGQERERFWYRWCETYGTRNGGRE